EAFPNEAIARRLVGDTLLDGMYLIFPNLADVNLGELHAEDGYYSRIWKHKLNQAYAQDPQGLLGRLRRAGIDLRLLKTAVYHWRRSPTTVIHAPQQKRHFQALINVLGIESDATSPGLRGAWWQYAWREIAHARGEAIQEGLHGQELIDGQLIEI